MLMNLSFATYVELILHNSDMGNNRTMLFTMYRNCQFESLITYTAENLEAYIYMLSYLYLFGSAICSTIYYTIQNEVWPLFTSTQPSHKIILHHMSLGIVQSACAFNSYALLKYHHVLPNVLIAE